MGLKQIRFPYNFEARGWQDSQHFFRVQECERVIDEDTGQKVGEDKIIDVPVDTVADLFPELEKINAVALQSINDREAEIVKLTAQLSAAEERAISWENQAKAAMLQVSQQTAQFLEIQNKLGPSIEQARKMKSDNEAMRDAQESQTRLIDAAGHELDIAKTRMTELNQTVADQETRLKAADKRIDELVTQVGNLNSSLADLMATLRGERAGRQAERTDYLSQISNLKAERDQLSLKSMKVKDAATV